MDMLMLFIGGLLVPDKYGNSSDDYEDKDSSGDYINNCRKGDIHLNKTITETERMTIFKHIKFKNKLLC